MKILTVRVTKEVEKIIKDLRSKYPTEYRTKADVLRAGVFTLKRWRTDRDGN